MIPAEILNPANVDPRKEYPHDIQPDTDNWTEYHYFFCYDKAQQTGISFHLGRLREDLRIWRTILFVYLPNGEVMAHKLSGVDDAPYSYSAGPLRLTCVEPMRVWAIEFHGALQAMKREDLAYDVLKDGVDEVVSFRFILEAAEPFFSLDPNAMEGLPNMGWAHDHYEQIHHMRGEITYRGKTVDLQGVAVRDHSSGPRDTGKPYGGCFVNMLFPSGIVISFTQVKTPNYDGTYGRIYWGDNTPAEPIKVLKGIPINDADTPPESVNADVLADGKGPTLLLSTSRGELEVAIEYLHSVVTTYVPPSAEVGGTDYSRPESAQQTKIAAAFTCNGEEGLGEIDRYARIKTLKRK